MTKTPMDPNEDTSADVGSGLAGADDEMGSGEPTAGRPDDAAFGGSGTRDEVDRGL